MVYCPKCGKKLEEDSIFCTKCGKKINIEKSKTSIEKNIEDFADEIDKLGKKVSKHIEKTIKDVGSDSKNVVEKSTTKMKKVANKVEKDLDNFGKCLEHKDRQFYNWYDERFGFFSPVISSFIGLIVLSIMIIIFRFIGREFLVFADIAAFFSKYLAFIFIFMLFSSYTAYLTRHYHKWFKWVSPLTSAISFVFGFWIFIQVLNIINNSINGIIISWFLSISDILMPIIALLIIVIGYMILFVSIFNNQIIHDLNHKKTAKVHTKNHEKISNEKNIKKLYRSGENKIIGGICGGFSEYIQIDVTIIRIIFVILFLITLGFIILPYFIFWIIIPRNPNHSWN